MANLGTLTAHIGADTTGLRSGLAQSQAQISRFSAGAMRSFAKLSGAFAALGVAVGGLALFRNITKIGIDFEQTMATVAGVMRATAKESVALTAAARRMGETTEWSASEAGGALQFLGMAGFEANKAIKALPGTLDLATAGQIGLGRAADIATNALTAMGLEVEELERVNDVFVGTITRSNTNMEMMAESFKYAAPVARAYGYTIEELSGLIGMLGNAGIQGCYDDKTEVLTRRGWLKWSKVSKGDDFATRNPKTGHIEYQKAKKLIRYKHKGRMYLVQNRNVDLCVTPDHRMWIKRRDHKKWQIQRANEVDGKAVSYETGGLKWKGKNPATYCLPCFSQNRGSWKKEVEKTVINSSTWATFLGLYLSEGSCIYDRSGYRVTITQKPKSKNYRKMLKALQSLPWSVREENGRGLTINNEQLYREVKPLGKCAEKYIPQYAKDWSPRLLNLLLKSLLEGDGDDNGAYYTSSKQLADDVCEIALKLGHAISLVKKSSAGRISNYDKENRAIISRYDQWKVNIHKKQINPHFHPYEYRGKHGRRLNGSRFPIRGEWIDYDGEVFCAEVPNHLLIVRRNGKAIVSGNSMAGTQLAMAIQKTSKVTKDYNLPGGKFVDVLEQLHAKGYSASQVIDMFGLRAGRAAGVLYEATDATREFQETLAGVSGEAGRLADKMRSTVGASFKELKSVIESLAIDVFETYRDELKGLVVDTTAWIREHKTEMLEVVESIKNSLVATVRWIAENKEGLVLIFKSLIAIKVVTYMARLTMQMYAFAASIRAATIASQGFAATKFGALLFGVGGAGLAGVAAGIAAIVGAWVLIGDAAGTAKKRSDEFAEAYQKSLESMKTSTIETWEVINGEWVRHTETVETWLAQVNKAKDLALEMKMLARGAGAILLPGVTVTPEKPPPGKPRPTPIITIEPPTMAVPTETLAEWLDAVKAWVAEYKAIQQNRYDWLYEHEQISADEYMTFLGWKLEKFTEYSDEWIAIQQRIDEVEAATAQDTVALFKKQYATTAKIYEAFGNAAGKTFADIFTKNQSLVDSLVEGWKWFMHQVLNIFAEILAKWITMKLIMSSVGGPFSFLLEKGGPVKAMQAGGLISGPRWPKDSIPIMATGGEFMMPEPAVRDIGIPALEYMKRTHQLPGEASGGGTIVIEGMHFYGTKREDAYWITSRVEDKIIEIVEEGIRTRKLEV